MRWIERCLSSVRNSSLQSDLFIVDNGSTDGTIEYINEHYPMANFIVSKENLGFGRANNLGFEYAIKNNYDYVYLLNQDAWIQNNDILRLIECHKRNSEYGILSPIQVNREVTRVDRNFMTSIPASLIDTLLVTHNNIPSVYQNQRSTPAAHWLIPISVIKKVGGFSPAFTHYGEDFDYTHRAQYWNYKCGIVTHTYGIHDREDRILPPNKIMHIVHMTLIYIYINPNLNKKTQLKLILKHIMIYFPTYPLLCIKKLLKFIIDLPRLRKIKKTSLNEGAFL